VRPKKKDIAAASSQERRLTKPQASAASLEHLRAGQALQASPARLNSA